MIALILLNRLAEAVAAGRMALMNLLPEGDGCHLLAAIALLAALQGRLAAAARVIGRDDAIAARTGQVVHQFRCYCAPASNRCLPAWAQKNSNACGGKAP